LKHPLSDAEIFPVAQAEHFVEELHRRWKEQHPAGHVVTPEPRRIDTSLPQSGIFLSYCHGDYPIACRICGALDQARLDVWFDNRDLHAGDEFERRIAGQIARSLFFVAVISQHSLSPELRFFHFEWHHAEARSKFAAFDMPYVMPLAIDDTSPDDERLPPFLRRVQWTRAPSGHVPTDFIERLVAAYRRVQRSPHST
jgi:hypothetical protein